LVVTDICIHYMKVSCLVSVLRISGFVPKFSELSISLNKYQESPLGGTWKNVNIQDTYLLSVSIIILIFFQILHRPNLAQSAIMGMQSWWNINKVLYHLTVCFVLSHVTNFLNFFASRAIYSLQKLQQIL
jgi:hypothetical protein